MIKSIENWPGSTCKDPLIESAPAPAAPTDEELAAAKESAREIARQQRRENLGLPETATDAECEAAEAADDVNTGVNHLINEMYHLFGWGTGGGACSVQICRRIEI